MVRLKSNRWYSSDGQRRSRVSASHQVAGSRRIVSLCFLLALVVLLMQKAADPKHVRNAFQALGVPLNQPQLVQDTVGGGQIQSPSAATSSSGNMSPFATTCNDVIPRLLDATPNPQIIDLSRRWFEIATPAALAATPSAPTANSTQTEMQSAAWDALETDSLQRLEQLIQQTQASTLVEENKRLWLESLTDFRDQWISLWEWLDTQTKRPDNLLSEFESAFSDYLDQRLMATLEDASPWSNTEATAFWRLLQRGSADQSSDSSTRAERSLTPPLVYSLQLESEASNYRNRLVRFRGTIRRLEHVMRDDPPIANLTQGYWLMWLRGEDDALQPIAAYTTQNMQPYVQAIDDRSVDYPAIELHAIPAKRLAYASPSGVQVAPTLFAIRIDHLPQAPAAVPPVASAELWSQLGTALVLASLLATAILLPIYRQWRRRTTRRSTEQWPPRNRTIVLWLLATGFSAAPLSESAVWAQEVPPWAVTEGDATASLLGERLRNSFTASALEELREHVAGNRAEFPKAALQAIDTISRIGWHRVLQLDSPIAIDDHISIRIRKLSGWARLAMPEQLTDAQRTWFQQDLSAAHLLYRVELQPDENSGDEREVETPPLTTVFFRDVPQLWLAGARLRQPLEVNAVGVFDDSEPTAVCWFAQRPAWKLTAEMQPEDLEPRLPDHLWQLGRLGWDLGNCEIVRSHNQQTLASEETTAFYSLIHLAENAAPATQSAAVAPAFTDPLTILADAQQNLGKPLRWRVRLVSGTLIAVDDPQAAAALGANRYVQFDGFVDIGAQVIHYQLAQTPSNSGGKPEEIEFVGEFPVTIVAPVSSSFVPSQFRQAEDGHWSIGQYVALDGWFYRLWSYQSDLVRSKTITGRQAAPLVVARSITAAQPVIRGKAETVGWFGYALCAATLVVLGVILYLAAGSMRHRTARS